ncbi:MAG: hypothetical protein FRX48_08857 [Lasallia pustulata]|uniref:Apple domain-containing protein n=1 Tax=Lasallia pustulata TaxID=136370 RepID=A0A5M8PDA9_9LECA|nr:MAG: hypothetical protein FRX48_08857 [Lasallia pustulata]
MDSRSSIPDGIELVPSDGIQTFYHQVDKQVAESYLGTGQHGTNNDPIQYESHGESPSDKHKTILGMGKKRTWGLFFLVGIIVVAALVGVAAGVSTAAKNKSPAAATTTITASPQSPVSSSPSSTASATATTIAASASDCPTANGTVYTSKYTTSGSVPPDAGLIFTLYCQLQFAHSDTCNMFEVLVSSLDQCVEACASYNFFHGNRGCQGAVFNTAAAIPGNCWALSGNGNGTGVSNPNSDLYYGWLTGSVE